MMKKLLCAGIHRYIKHPILWIGLAASFAAGLWAGGKYEEWGGSLFAQDQMVFFIILAAVLCPVICREYAEGGFKNKIAKGCRRIHILISEAILVFAASTLMFIIYASGFVINEHSRLVMLPWQGLLFIAFGLWLATISIAAIYLLVSITVKNRAIAPILCIILIWMTYLITFDISFELTRIILPEDPSLPISREDIEYELQGAERIPLQTLYYMSPYSKLFRYEGMLSTIDPEGKPRDIEYVRIRMKEQAWLAPWSAVMTLLPLAAAYPIFKRKNIK